MRFQDYKIVHNVKRNADFRLCCDTDTLHQLGYSNINVSFIL